MELASAGPDSRIGPYIVHQPLAEGGMAYVFHAIQPGGGEVALKVSRFAQTGQRYGDVLRHEAALLEQLDHPNIVKIMPIPLPGAEPPPFCASAVNVRGAPWYYAMEYLPGGALIDCVERGRTLPVDVACAVGYQMGRALLYLHEVGAAHLDVKAENILLKHSLRKGAVVHPVLVDFGVAAQNRHGVETTGGTLLIMAPERLDRPAKSAGRQPLDASKMDVYSLGVTLYRVLTGQYPFTGTALRELISAILSSPVIPPSGLKPDIPGEVDALVLRCLEKDPAARIGLPALIATLERLPYRISRLQRDI
jgi:eukaryotic-like serine/threonine-protein kinase